MDPSCIFHKAKNLRKKRKNNNRYDRFPINFYRKVQNSFLKIGRSNKKRYIILDNSENTTYTEKYIFEKVIKVLKKKI